VFLKACESWDWSGTEPYGDPARVEAVRKLYWEPEGEIHLLPVAIERDSFGLPRLLAHRPARRQEGHGPLQFERTIGERPQHALSGLRLEYGWRAPDFDPSLLVEGAEGVRAPVERFYVVPSSYPMYSGPNQEHVLRVANDREADNKVHLAALELFVRMGAVPFTLPDPPSIARMKEGSLAEGTLSTHALVANHLRWWDAYRQRVLVQYENKRGAARFPGGWASNRYSQLPLHGASRPDHNSRILFPAFFRDARLMRRVGKRWKNNPARNEGW